MTDFPIKMNEYLPLRDVVYDTLRKAILRGNLKPGERLMEIALSEKLGVSRTPIREAMRKLEQDGLVTMEPRKGAQVANITVKDLNDVLEVRIALENLAIEKACERLNDDYLQELNAALESFRAKVTVGSLEELAEADEDFHDIIFRAADNQRLLQTLNHLREQIYRYRIEYLKDEETRSQLVEEHEQMLLAIQNHNVTRAQELSFAHLENQRKAILKSISSQ